MNAKQSIAAVVLLLGGAISAGFLFRDRIEQDIRTRVAETLANDEQRGRFNNVTVADVDYLDVALGGSVAQENDRFDVKNVVQGVRGVADVTTDQIVIQENAETPLTNPALSDPKPPSDATRDLEPDLFDELDEPTTTEAEQNSDALVNDLALPADFDDSLAENANEPTTEIPESENGSAEPSNVASAPNDLEGADTVHDSSAAQETLQDLDSETRPAEIFRDEVPRDPADTNVKESEAPSPDSVPTAPDSVDATPADLTQVDSLATDSAAIDSTPTDTASVDHPPATNRVVTDPALSGPVNADSTTPDSLAIDPTTIDPATIDSTPGGIPPMDPASIEVRTTDLSTADSSTIDFAPETTVTEPIDSTTISTNPPLVEPAKLGQLDSVPPTEIASTNTPTPTLPTAPKEYASSVDKVGPNDSLSMESQLTPFDRPADSQTVEPASPKHGGQANESTYGTADDSRISKISALAEMLANRTLVIGDANHMTAYVHIKGKPIPWTSSTPTSSSASSPSLPSLASSAAVLDISSVGCIGETAAPNRAVCESDLTNCSKKSNLPRTPLKRSDRCLHLPLLKSKRKK